MIVPYDDAVHRRFVVDAFCKGQGVPFSAFDRLMANGGKCAVKVGSSDPNVFMGFAVTLDDSVVMQYTKPALRADGYYIADSLIQYLRDAP